MSAAFRLIDALQNQAVLRLQLVVLNQAHTFSQRSFSLSSEIENFRKQARNKLLSMNIPIKVLTACLIWTEKKTNLLSDSSHVERLAILYGNLEWPLPVL